MYDPQTRALIQDAPALDGLDRERLPEEMTRAYASIVAFRLRMRQLVGTFPQELVPELERFRRLANTYESYVALLPASTQRVSAAFVAASAHHLVNRADRLRNVTGRPVSDVARNFITSDVSALLLFLIAGYQADAAEMAKQITGGGRQPVAGAVLESVRALAEGRLRAVRSLKLDSSGASFADPDEAATAELYYRLFTGIQLLATRLLGEGNRDPLEVFRGVQTASVDVLDLTDIAHRAVEATRFVSAFPGPHQLATLLIQAGGTLLEQSVMKVPPHRALKENGMRCFGRLRKGGHISGPIIRRLCGSACWIRAHHPL